MTHDTKGSTSGAILVVLLVLVVGFIVWYITSTQEEAQPEPAIEVNLGSNE